MGRSAPAIAAAAIAITALFTAIWLGQSGGAESVADPPPPSSAAAPTFNDLVAEGARREVASRTRYIETYQVLAYPGGDVDPGIGVCTDLVVRAFRHAGIDLQKEVHEDRVANPGAYPTHIWESKAADRNIDHRRCQNLAVYFSRFARRLPPDDPASWQPGDVIFFVRSRAAHPWHVGIVADADALRPTLHHLYPPRASTDPVEEHGPIHSVWRWPNRDTACLELSK